MSAAVLTATKGSELLDVGRLEMVKWLAFAAMLADHADLLLFDRALGLQVIGAFAFPAFCLSFGLGLGVSRDPLRVAARTVIAGAVAQGAWLLAYQGHPANMLAVFSACAAVVALERRSVAAALVAALAVLWLSAQFGEGGFATPMLVAGGYAASRLRSVWPLVLAGVVWLGVSPSVAAVLAVLAVAFWPAWWPRVPRVPGALLWAYPGHLLALAVLASALAPFP